ncbi:sensor histidine kinase [Pseudonocardia abyssalis]|uniref:histidine kinase n=1 Tax=Pseudonocardia abyssalis TaxID=2792008 RepID=A0ABS6UVE1_9PSEU|nr:HAMP domain-containing sensor histidine kinase [Pseudonocardia abyssalis]MBW0116224.1 HAMP domain-containing histidine kinase [Pseudonocardia abyssalis]MBW0135689.1 HAMP domain-containing histidine kinase [Pseudonocardia abyssalis]
MRTALADVCVTVAAVAVVVGLAGSSLVGGALDPRVAIDVLTLTAAATAAGAAFLGALAARLTEDPRPRWIAAALSVYAVLVLPSNVLAVDLPVRSMRLVAYLVVVALLLAAVRPPRLGVLGTWAATTVGALLAVAALQVPAVAPGLVAVLVEGPLVTIAVVVGWTAVAAAVLVEGLSRRSIPRRRVGLGLVVLAGAQLYRVLGTTAGDLVFGGLRLLGLAIVVAGMAHLVVRSLAELHDTRFAQQEELVVAALHMERAGELAAERDHELRNGLAGLAGITHLLSSQVDDEDHERLRHAVLAELGRLHELIDGAEHATGTYLVAPVLEGLVALRRSAGAAVGLTVDEGLRASGDSAVLAQIVTNLLANCDRHAPGAAVTLRARADGDRVVVQVRDTGPGLPPGREDEVLLGGVHDPAAGGSGLGLSITRRLVEREGGTLTVATVEDPRGCLATVTVPADVPATVRERARAV